MAKIQKSSKAVSYVVGLGVLLLVTVSATWLIITELEEVRAPTRELWRQVAVGDSETEVRELLGEPRYEYEAATAPANYYVEGWGRKERAITGKVLIYFGKVDLILYVYFDRSGRVEETVIATS